MRIATLALVILLALGANGGGCSSGVVGVQDYGRITGRVLDATTNRPIPSAIVSVGSLFVGTADPAGAFTMAGIPVGDQTVTARSPGFTTASTDVEVSKGQTAQAGYLRLVPVTIPVGTPTLPAPATPQPPPAPVSTEGPALTATPAPTASPTLPPPAITPAPLTSPAASASP